ncbi:MAG: hypothetical protein JST40_01145 [Armatimonadetes bacterium]|nr:hypothetical protein [Armatimonadota bacterium]
MSRKQIVCQQIELMDGLRGDLGVLSQALQVGAWDQVLQASRDLLQDEPCHLVALEGRAQALWQLHEYQRAIEVSRRLIGLNPREPGYYMLQGMCHQMMGRFVAALDCYRKALNEAKKPETRRQVYAQMESLESLIGMPVIPTDEDSIADFGARPVRSVVPHRIN